MKKRIVFCLVLLVVTGVFTVFNSSCKEANESLPVLDTSPVTYISIQSVICSGNITDDSDAEVTERGICWSTTNKPTTANDKISSGAGTGSFDCTIDGLAANTQYYMRAYAINDAGTGYGNEITFRTWNSEIVTDIDGNSYHTVTIGSQVWLVENLSTTHYRNGEPITYISGNDEWELVTSEAYCAYNHDPGNVAIYGRLYNWFAVNDSRNIAPNGCHVATDAEWTSLTNYLGGEGIAGGKLKEAGLIHWKEPNSEATNETGFSALPGGHREYGGTFDYIIWGGGWWTSTEENPNDSWIRYMDCGNCDVWRYLEDKRFGRSVRCLKD